MNCSAATGCTPSAFLRERSTRCRWEITTESGTLGLTIQKDGQDTVYEGNHLETGTFTVYLRESGTYRVNFLANEHKGSYRFSWGPVTEESL